MKKTILGSSMLMSGVIAFSIWQTSAADSGHAFLYVILAIIGSYLAISSLKET